ncbi:MAG TPA: hypothetical protein VF735_22690 [Pyrinomonadaceae bacterium]|jgi:hypothetical protein
MHTSRITNASLFVTVLSACLGLVMTGVPAHAHTQPGLAAAVNRSQALVAGAASQPQQARKLAAVSNSYFQIAACQPAGEPAEVFYQNNKALTNLNRLLVVTRLPRAGLAPPPTTEQQPTAI